MTTPLVYIHAYDEAQANGNDHNQSTAFAEFTLFTELARRAPPGSYHCARQAAHWLREMARLEVRAK